MRTMVSADRGMVAGHSQTALKPKMAVTAHVIWGMLIALALPAALPASPSVVPVPSYPVSSVSASDLPLGSVVYDDTWLWNGAPLRWRIVHTNYGGMAGSVTLSATNSIANMPLFTGGWANHWSDATLRTYLNGASFHGVFSPAFSGILLPTAVPWAVENPVSQPSSGTVTDTVFIASGTELGHAALAGDGTVFDWFGDASTVTNRRRDVGCVSGQALYWTRTGARGYYEAQAYDMSALYVNTADGAFSSGAWSYDPFGIVPVLNILGTAQFTLQPDGSYRLSWPQGQTVTFPAPVTAPQKTDAHVCLEASASSGLPVSLSVVSGPGTITDGTNLTFTGVGDVTVVASQAGNGYWTAAASVTNVLKVYQLSVAQGPFAGGNTVTITNGNFGAITNVLVDGVAATITGSGLNWVSITLPATGSAGAKGIVIQTSDNGDILLAGAYTVNPPGRIFSETVTNVCTIGQGAYASGTTEANPVNIYWRSRHMQFVYTTNDLAAASYAGPGRVTKIGFNIVGQATNAMPDYLVRMKHTSASSLSAFEPEVGLIVCASNATYRPPATGFDMIPLTAPFEFNGTNNILLDTAFAQVLPNWDRSGQSTYDVAASRTWSVQNDNADLRYVFSGGTGQDRLPQLRMEIEREGFGVAPSSGSWLGGYPVTISGTNLCDGSDVTSVTLCGFPVSAIVSQSPTQIVVLAAAGSPGIGDVHVFSTSYGETVRPDAFTYLVPGLQVLGVDGNGVASGEAASVQKGTGFGHQLLAASTVRTLRLLNNGTMAVSIPGFAVSDPRFAVAGLPASIGPGDVGDFTVTFTPDAVGDYAASLQITNDSPTAVYVVNLSGSGFAVSPAAGPSAGGNTVTITNGYWGSVTNVLVGGVAATIQASGENWARITVPATGAAGAMDVIIQTSGNGDITLTAAYTVHPAGQIGDMRWMDYRISFSGDYSTDPNRGVLYPTNTAADGVSLWTYYHLTNTAPIVLMSADGRTNNVTVQAYGYSSDFGYDGYVAESFDWIAPNAATNFIYQYGVDTTRVVIAQLTGNSYQVDFLGSYKGQDYSWKFNSKLMSGVWSPGDSVEGGSWGLNASAVWQNPGGGGNNMDATNAAWYGDRYVTWPQVVPSNGAISLVQWPGSDAEMTLYKFLNCMRVRGYEPVGEGGVAPSSGSWSGGYQVTICGVSLCDGTAADVTRVTLCGVDAAVVGVSGSTQIVVTAGVSDVAGTGEVRIYSTAFGETAKASGFTYLPPAAPTALPPTQISPSAFKAHWTAVSEADHYVLDVSASSNFTGFVASYSNQFVGIADSAWVSGLADGTWYWYRLRACASNDLQSLNSNVIGVPTGDGIPWVAVSNMNGMASSGGLQEFPLDLIFAGTGLTYSAVSDAPTVVGVEIGAATGVLRLLYGVPGTATITVTATHVATGYSVSYSFTVTVVGAPDYGVGALTGTAMEVYQVITVTNTAQVLAAGVMVVVGNLDDPSYVLNRTSVNGDGDAVVEYPHGLAPGAAVAIKIIYGRAYGAQVTRGDPATVVAHLVLPPLRAPPAAEAVASDVVGAWRSADGGMVIAFRTVPGLQYMVQYRDSLTDVWRNVYPCVTATGTVTYWADPGQPATDPNPQDAPSRFYRILTFPDN